MNARPYPQKKDVDSIALNASLHPLEAPTKRFASTSSWMPLAQRTRLQKFHAWIPRDSMIQLNTNQSSQTHTTSTENRKLFSMQTIHVQGQSLQNMEQSQNTISKEWTQDHIHRRKMSTILFWMHLSSISRVRVATDTSKSQFYRSFWRPTSISRVRLKGCDWHLKIAILPPFLTSNVHFARKGCDWHLKIAILPQFLTFNLHFVRRGCGGYLKIAILPQFWTFNIHFVRKCCGGYLKIAILHQFLTFNLHFVRKGCGGYLKIAILPQFLTFNLHFVRKGCGGLTKIAILLRFWTSDVHEMLRLSRFVALRRHRPRLKREIERRARERKEEREKICRCEGARK